MIVCALGVMIDTSGSSRWWLGLSCGSVGTYFFFQARSWTPEKSLRLFGRRPQKHSIDKEA